MLRGKKTEALAFWTTQKRTDGLENLWDGIERYLGSETSVVLHETKMSRNLKRRNTFAEEPRFKQRWFARLV